MSKRMVDPDGHTWPITGSWCATCGMPMLRITADQTRHPTCQETP